MSVYRREKRQERRRLKGLRMGPEGYIPPSLGKRYVELNDQHLFGFVEFFDFVKEHEDRVRVLRTREHWGRSKIWNNPLDRLVQVYNSGGIGALVKREFPQSFLLEMDDDDTLEITFRLRF